MHEARPRRDPVRACILAFLLTVVLAFGLTACLSDEGGAAQWTAAQDDSLPCLTMKVAGGGTVAMPGDGWAARDGWIQLQLSGGSIGAQRIGSVAQDGDVLTVGMEPDGGPATLDLVVTEYRLEGGDPSQIEKVRIRCQDGTLRELQRG